VLGKPKHGFGPIGLCSREVAVEKLQPLVIELQAELRMAGDETRVHLSPQASREDNSYDKIMVA
jgi:hypothetical protein